MPGAMTSPRFMYQTYVTETLKMKLDRLHKEAAHMNTDALGDVESQLLSSLVFIRSNINSRAHINRLPVEILGLIFEEFVSIPFGAYNDRKRIGMVESRWTAAQSRVRSCIVLVEICRHWAAVARGTARLWNTFYDSPNSCRQVFLDRSRGTPLDVLVWSEPSGFMLDLLHSHASRIRSCQWPQFHPKHEALVKSIGANLESLRISGIPDYAAPDTVGLLSEFDRHVPRLQHFALASYPRIPEGKFPNLTRLTLHDCRGGIAAVAALLRGCPELEDLRITGLRTKNQNNGDNEASKGLVSLPKLQRISLCMASAPLLLRIMFGPETWVKVRVAQLDGDEVSAILGRLLPGRDISRISIMVPYRGYGRLHAAGPSSGVCIDGLLPSGFLRVSQTLPEILAPLPAREIWLQDNSIWQTDTLGPSLRALSAMETLHVSVHSYQWFQGFLGFLTQPGQLIRRPVCPRLSELHILVHRPLKAEMVVSVLAGAQRQLRLRRVVVGYSPGYEGKRKTSSEWDGRFPSISYEVFDKEPHMELPPVSQLEWFE